MDSLGRLEVLDMSYNRVREIRGLAGKSRLRVVFLASNKVRCAMGPLPPWPCSHSRRLTYNFTLAHCCPTCSLTNVQLRSMTGVEEAPTLERLDLGMNRIRTIDGVSSLTRLTELWLGKNKITRIEGLGTLRNLRKLDVQVRMRAGFPITWNRSPYTEDAQSNRLERIEGLETLAELEELYLGHNAIRHIEGLDTQVRWHARMQGLHES